MHKYAIGLAILSLHCGEDNYLTRTTYQCADGRFVDAEDKCPDEPAVPQPRFSCRDGRKVLTAEECQTPVTIEPLFCPDGSEVLDLADCLSPPDTEVYCKTLDLMVDDLDDCPPAMTGTFICPADASFVRDPADCPGQTIECPEGEIVELAGGITVNCPSPDTLVNNFYVCEDKSIVRHAFECPDGTEAQCPDGSGTSDEGACTCPPGRTITFENGLEFECPALDLPENCDYLQVTNMNFPESPYPQPIRIGRDTRGPTQRHLYHWRDRIPIFHIKLEACEGQEVRLDADSFHAVTSISLFGKNIEFTASVLGRDYTIRNTTIDNFGNLRPDFTVNVSKNAAGQQECNLVIAAREIELKIRMKESLPVGNYLIDVRDLRAYRVSDDVAVSPQPTPTMDQSIRIIDNPCNWTHAPDVYIGEPDLQTDFADINTGNSRWTNLTARSVRSCVPVNIDWVQYEINDPVESNQVPQDQQDFTGQWFGNPNRPVFSEARYDIQRGSVRHVLTAEWQDQNQSYPDVRRYPRAYTDTVDWRVNPGQRWDMVLKIKLSTEHPRNLGQTRAYNTFVKNIYGRRVDNNVQIQRYVIQEVQTFHQNL